MRNESILRMSRDIESLAKRLCFLPTAAANNMADSAPHDFGTICRILKMAYLPFREVSDRFARVRRSDSVIRVRTDRYTSAHQAALEQANRFCDFLWFHLDRSGYEAASVGNLTKEAIESGEWVVRAGFDPALIPKKWKLTKAIITDKLDESWKQAFRDIPAQIEDERARLMRVLEQPELLTRKDIAEKVCQTERWVRDRMGELGPPDQPKSGRRPHRWLSNNTNVMKFIDEHKPSP